MTGIDVPLIIFLLLFMFFLYLWFVVSSIKKAGPNEVLIISGAKRYHTHKDGSRTIVGYRTVKGGRTFVWPFIERVDRLSLEIMTINDLIENVSTADRKYLAFELIAQVKIENDDESIAIAAESFLSKKPDQIRHIAFQTFDGHLRTIAGSTTMEDIQSDFEVFMTRYRNAVSKDLSNMGLTIASFILRHTPETSELRDLSA